MMYNVKVYAIVKNPFDAYDREEQYTDVNVNSLAEALLEAAACIKQWQDDGTSVVITKAAIKEVNSRVRVTPSLLFFTHHLMSC